MVGGRSGVAGSTTHRWPRTEGPEDAYICGRPGPAPAPCGVPPRSPYLKLVVAPGPEDNEVTEEQLYW